MDSISRDGELPVGSCERKFQAVAFACNEQVFAFPDIPGILCWRIDKQIVGLVRMNKPMRNSAWRGLMPHSKIYALRGHRRWHEIEFAMREHDVFSSDKQLQAFNNAKRAMRIFSSKDSNVIRESYRSYIARLRIME
jgi:hypothetical protein